MTDLGDTLELLHTADERVRSFMGTFHLQVCPRPSYGVVLASNKEGPAIAGWSGAGPFPIQRVSTLRIWSDAGGDLLRVEVHEDHEVVSAGVRHGRDWWCRTREAGETHGQREPGDRWEDVPPFIRPSVLLNPARLLARLRLTAVGTGVQLGRPILQAHGRPRVEGADRGLSYELAVDAEYGVLLRRTILDAGTPVNVAEASDVAFNVTINSELFEVPDAQRSHRAPSA